MQNRLWSHLIDKSRWPAGPWHNEPDRLQWIDPASSLPCLMIRVRYSGNWCGYVGLNEAHPCWNEFYTNINVEAYGDLTYSGWADNDEQGIRFSLDEGDENNYWIIGFDCNHSFDFAPGEIFIHGNPKDYMCMIDVADEVTKLAAQLRYMLL